MMTSVDSVTSKVCWPDRRPAHDATRPRIARCGGLDIPAPSNSRKRWQRHGCASKYMKWVSGSRWEGPWRRTKGASMIQPCAPKTRLLGGNWTPLAEAIPLSPLAKCCKGKTTAVCANTMLDNEMGGRFFLNSARPGLAFLGHVLNDTPRQSTVECIRCDIRKPSGTCSTEHWRSHERPTGRGGGTLVAGRRRYRRRCRRRLVFETAGSFGRTCIICRVLLICA